MEDCQWSPGALCTQVPCRCPTFSDFVETLAPPASGMLHALLGRADSKINVFSSNTEFLECSVRYEFDGRPGVVECCDKCVVPVIDSMVCFESMTDACWTGIVHFLIANFHGVSKECATPHRLAKLSKSA